MKKFLFLCLFSLLAAVGAFAQVGNVGSPIRDIEIVQKCDDGTTSFYDVVIYTVGLDDGTVLGTFDVDGNDYTPTGTVTLGFCGAETTTAASDTFDFEVFQQCDDGTPFWTVYQIAPDGSITDLGDFDAAGAAYTITGTVTDGPCATDVVPTQLLQEITSTLTLSTNTYSSISVSNVGLSNGDVTVGGSAVTLAPGQGLQVDAQYDPVTHEWQLPNEVALDATGTTFLVYTREK